jgi:hypothetical protein
MLLAPTAAAAAAAAAGLQLPAAAAAAAAASCFGTQVGLAMQLMGLLLKLQPAHDKARQGEVYL